MPPADDHAGPTTTAAPPSSGRRLISCIASPFTAKARSFADYSIKIDDPHKQYSPGDVVTGCVELRVVKATRITHIVVSLHGFVQVYRNPGSPPSDGHRANGVQVGTGKGRKTGEVYGNGFATLFEDEVVLCGDGRLAEGVYKFEFELVFPDRDLPSSITFERGTISYQVTATITRPVAISPIIQFDHEVCFAERIDIADVYPPKPRTITLEPLSRKVRRTATRKLIDTSEQTTARSRRESEASSSPSARGDVESPGSPSPSEASLESGSLGPTSQDSAGLSARQSERTVGSRISHTHKTITATVEPSIGGCLRGDNVPIRVVVKHTKFIKSLYGVIITLYRQARVDMHPAPGTRGQDGKYDDVFPKSITGLGGLSLSGAGSSHTFRKDLSQTMLPLVIDPTTLTAEVHGKVHVPDEAFPTISTVPGALISFRYYIEVVIDIQGKLSSQGGGLTHPGTVSAGVGASGFDGERVIYAQQTTPVVDTAALRRDKGVVSSTFEIVIGTKDSTRRRGKRRAAPTTPSEGQSSTGSPPPRAPDARSARPLPAQAAPPVDYAQSYGYGYGPDPRWYDPNAPWDDPHYNADGAGNTGFVHQAPAYFAPPVPMPRMDDESQLSEKERMRRAEARLLPSQPPGVAGPAGEEAPSAPYLPDEAPSAPYLDEEADLAADNGHAMAMTLTPPTPRPHTAQLAVAPEYAASSPSASAGPASLARTPSYDDAAASASLAPSIERTPTYDEAAASGPSSSRPPPPPTDDKDELRRRMLLESSSAPPLAPSTSNAIAEAAEDDITPTAPPADLVDSHHPPQLSNEGEEDELYASDAHDRRHTHVERGHEAADAHDSHAEASASADLPRYER